ncbi:hypothetical protein B0H10DRAFT_2430545 [Mycena sp. CBHHK59/15]|nr:hypothetical protein B0H10DRAFT_2430545 [Mycena sp. CBHHK59/15]
MPSTDYPTTFGFHSIPAAVVFTLVYFPLFLWFIRQSIKDTTYFYISPTVFCLMQVAAFVLCAILSGSTTLSDNLNLPIADDILFGVGFFVLLYSTLWSSTAHLQAGRLDIFDTEICILHYFKPENIFPEHLFMPFSRCHKISKGKRFDCS